MHVFVVLEYKCIKIFIKFHYQQMKNVYHGNPCKNIIIISIIILNKERLVDK